MISWKPAALLGVGVTGAGTATVTAAVQQSAWVRVAIVAGLLAALAVVLWAHALRARIRDRHARRLELLENEVIRSAQAILDPEQRTDRLLRLVETHHGPPPPPPAGPGDSPSGGAA